MEFDYYLSFLFGTFNTVFWKLPGFSGNQVENFACRESVFKTLRFKIVRFGTFELSEEGETHLVYLLLLISVKFGSFADL